MEIPVKAIAMETMLGLSALAYLIGSIPSGYLLVRVVSGRDVRSYGSHSIGAINVFRVGGIGLGMLTLLLDAGKAFGVVLLAAVISPGPWEIASAAFMVLLGHAFSLWLFLKDRRFSEGKGVACALGVLTALSALDLLPWSATLLPVGIWAVGLVAPRLLMGRWPCISPATMAAALSIPVVVSAARPATAYVILSMVIAALIFARHKNNIRRLLAGTEPRLGERLSGHL